MSEIKPQKPKARHCYHCGAVLENSAYYDRYDTCGERECERSARDGQQQERDEAHEKLDRDMGWS